MGAGGGGDRSLKYFIAFLYLYTLRIRLHICGTSILFVPSVAQRNPRETSTILVSFRGGFGMKKKIKNVDRLYCVLSLKIQISIEKKYRQF